MSRTELRIKGPASEGSATFASSSAASAPCPASAAWPWLGGVSRSSAAAADAPAAASPALLVQEDSVAAAEVAGSAGTAAVSACAEDVAVGTAEPRSARSLSMAAARAPLFTSRRKTPDPAAVAVRRAGISSGATSAA